MDASARDIVVGYDDTTASVAAARWAAELAEATAASLRLVHAWSWPLLGQGVSGIPVIDPAGPRNQASRLLDDAAEDLSARFPGLAITAELRPGMPREVLEELSGQADLLVVGTRGLGPVLGTLLGSVSRGLLHDAGCPVAVIRSAQLHAGPVLVAVDGSASAGAAVDVAADLAAAWQVPLRVVHVRVRSDAPQDGGSEAWEADGVLEEGVARAAARRRRLQISSRVLQDRVAEGLLAAAIGARMLVLGHRGLSASRFGSTAHATVLHATGNILVVRRTAPVT